MAKDGRHRVGVANWSSITLVDLNQAGRGHIKKASLLIYMIPNPLDHLNASSAHITTPFRLLQCPQTLTSTSQATISTHDLYKISLYESILRMDIFFMLFVSVCPLASLSSI